MDIERWMLLHLAVLGGVPVESLEPDEALATHGLDSFDALQMSYEIQRVFGCAVDPEFFTDPGRSVAEVAGLIRPMLPGQDG